MSFLINFKFLLLNITIEQGVNLIVKKVTLGEKKSPMFKSLQENK